MTALSLVSVARLSGRSLRYPAADGVEKSQIQDSEREENVRPPGGLGRNDAGKVALLESREEQEAELLLLTNDSHREVFHPVSISTSFHVLLLYL